MILDTSILVDYSRNYKPAQEFLNSTYRNQNYAISIITAIEVIKGARDKKSQAAAEDLLSMFTLLPLTQRVGMRSFEFIKKYHLNYSFTLADSLIAATALEHKALLLTRNLKDFDFIPKLIVQSPY